VLRNLYDLDSIKSDNYRPLDPHAVEALAASIKEVGLQEPIQLFEVNETKELFVISGHHRLEALKKVKRDPTHAHKIFQALITTGTTDDLKSQKTAISSVVSNILRTDLTIIDRAEAYQRLKDRGASAKEIGRMVQKDKRTIEMTLNVAQIPDESKEFVPEQEQPWQKNPLL
jgi:ParB family chromosome partitioning protein